MIPRSALVAVFGVRIDSSIGAPLIASLRLAGPLVLALAQMMVCIVSGLYPGGFTPPEAGGIVATFTLILALIRQCGIKGGQIEQTLLKTLRIIGMIFAILICTLQFSKFLALSEVANWLGASLTGPDMNRWVITALIALTYLSPGMMMDAPALLAIPPPITHAVMMRLGFDPIWFGVVVVQAASNGRMRLEGVLRGLAPLRPAGLRAFLQIAPLLRRR
ncbi:MAG: C4-dicarboxylate transporter DctM subunit [Paracoccaceae bacterium]|jgi:C4-dicarboxylate transporter DctM subunit